MTVLSLGVPVLAGLVPVHRRRTHDDPGRDQRVRLERRGYGRGLLDRALGHVQGFSRPLLISLRNTMRRKARLVLTLATLVLAGAIFTGRHQHQASMSGQPDADVPLLHRRTSTSTSTATYRTANIAGLLGGVPGVAQCRGLDLRLGRAHGPRRIGPAGQERVAIDRLTVIAPPADSADRASEVSSGRWLLPEDQNALVMCTTAMSAHPEWHLGSVVHLRLNSKAEADFTIVGTFPFASGEGNKIGMASYAYLADLLNERGQASSFRIVTSPHDTATQDRVRDAAAAQFKALGYKATVTSLHTSADSLGMILNVIVDFLLGLAVLIALVGGLGLAGMMSMNVMERTREIGVMRSIGASNGTIMQLVLIEGVLIGLLSWVGGVLWAFPSARSCRLCSAGPVWHALLLDHGPERRWHLAGGRGRAVLARQLAARPQRLAPDHPGGAGVRVTEGRHSFEDTSSVARSHSNDTFFDLDPDRHSLSHRPACLRLWGTLRRRAGCDVPGRRSAGSPTGVEQRHRRGEVGAPAERHAQPRGGRHGR